MTTNQEHEITPSAGPDFSPLERATGLLVTDPRTVRTNVGDFGSKFPIVTLAIESRQDEGEAPAGRVSYTGVIDRATRDTSRSPFDRRSATISHAGQEATVPLLPGEPMVPDTEKIVSEMSPEEVERVVKLANGVLDVLDVQNSTQSNQSALA